LRKAFAVYYSLELCQAVFRTQWLVVVLTAVLLAPQVLALGLQ